MFPPPSMVRVFLGLLLGTFLTGCEFLGYYKQAIGGQVSILANRRPIAQLIRSQQTPAKLKKQLRLVLTIREFAEKELFLPAEKHYLSYVEINRPYVVWNVFAASEFSFKPQKWCYPMVGCVSYRGYFAEKDARRYAGQLENDGLDVYVGGVTAYSTLGWFNDPLFSTFINSSEARLAGLIFHELAHQVIYIPGATSFNESFATMVETEGLRRWFVKFGKKKDYNSWLRRRQYHKQFVELISKYRGQLETLYKKDFPIKKKRESKASILTALKNEYEDKKRSWRGYQGYDAWFAKSLNNAKILSVSIYHDLVPAFRAIFNRQDGNFREFYRQCKILAGKPKEERLRELEVLLN